MDREHEVDILRRLLDLHEHRSTSEAAAPRRQQSGKLVGLSCELPGSGSYFTADLGTVPVEPAMIHFHEQLDLVLGTSDATVGA